MAHELDFSIGRAAVAFRGETPWHGLGETIQPEDDIDTIRFKAGLEYHVDRTPVRYEVNQINHDGTWNQSMLQMPSKQVLVRSDTKDALSVVSDKYQVVQPAEVLEFYRDLVADYGFQIEVAGALKGGRKIWALANTNEACNIKDDDKVKGYLLLATSYDGTMATQARFTSVRVVCNNTLTAAIGQGKANVTVPHSTAFDARKVKLDLNIGSTWQDFTKNAINMTDRPVTQQESIMFLMDAYYELTSKDQIAEFTLDADGERSERKERNVKQFIERMQKHLFESPGAQMASAKGTLWGLVNAVTRDIDFSERRSIDTRLDRAWFGEGERIKQRAFNRALAML